LFSPLRWPGECGVTGSSGVLTREHECHHSFAPRDWWDLANNSKS